MRTTWLLCWLQGYAEGHKRGLFWLEGTAEDKQSVVIATWIG